MILTGLKRMMAIGIAAASIVSVPAMAAQASPATDAQVEVTADTNGLDYAYCTTWASGSEFGANCYGVPGTRFTVRAVCKDRRGYTQNRRAQGTIGLGMGSAEGECRGWNQRVVRVGYSWGW